MRAKDHQPLPHPSMVRPRAKGPSAAARSAAQSGEQSCEVIATHAVATGDSVAPVSPAISPAVNPESREQLKPRLESEHQSGNQSGNGNTKPNCYECKHRRDLSYSAHSECKHPALEGKGRVLAIACIMTAGSFPPFNLKGNAHGIRNSWFAWPMDYDPIWLESCNAFERNSAAEQPDKEGK